MTKQERATSLYFFYEIVPYCVHRYTHTYKQSLTHCSSDGRAVFCGAFSDRALIMTVFTLKWIKL